MDRQNSNLTQTHTHTNTHVSSILQSPLNHDIIFLSISRFEFSENQKMVLQRFLLVFKVNLLRNIGT